MRRHGALAVIAAILILFTSNARGQQQPIHRIGVLANAQIPENIQAWETSLRDRG
jgi:hypothetical protein